MRAIFCGDRDWDDEALIEKWMLALRPSVVIEGEARGADTLARQVAERHGIPVEGKEADWISHGKAAGLIRNREMLKENPDTCVAFHDNIKASKGTADMVNISRKAGLRVIVVSHTSVADYAAARSRGFFA